MIKCKNCNKDILFDETRKDNIYYIKMFPRKKYCNELCMKEYIKKINLKKLQLPINEHNINVKIINNIIHGEIMLYKNKCAPGNNPDIIKDNRCIEIEMFSKTNKFKNIEKKKGISNVLIIMIPESTNDIFDEIYFFDNKKLIKYLK
jgi:hypothetical protein